MHIKRFFYFQNLPPSTRHCAYVAHTYPSCRQVALLCGTCSKWTQCTLHCGGPRHESKWIDLFSHCSSNRVCFERKLGGKEVDTGMHAPSDLAVRSTALSAWCSRILSQVNDVQANSVQEQVSGNMCKGVTILTTHTIKVLCCANLKRTEPRSQSETYPHNTPNILLFYDAVDDTISKLAWNW